MKVMQKIMTRLAAGAMALLLAVGTAATDMSVYAAETKTQEGTTEKKRSQDLQIFRTTRKRFV